MNQLFYNIDMILTHFSFSKTIESLQVHVHQSIQYKISVRPWDYGVRWIGKQSACLESHDVVPCATVIVNNGSHISNVKMMDLYKIISSLC